MFFLIVLNVLAVIGESMSWVKEAGTTMVKLNAVYSPPDHLEAIGSTVLNSFELFSVLVFTFEYAANVWSAPANNRRAPSHS